MAIDRAFHPAELGDAFEYSAETFGYSNRTVVSESYEADDGFPAQRLVGVFARPLGRLSCESMAVFALHQAPTDLSFGKPFGTPEAAPADEITSGILLQRPIAETAQMPMAEVKSDAAPRVVAVQRSADEL